MIRALALVGLATASLCAAKPSRTPNAATETPAEVQQPGEPATDAASSDASASAATGDPVDVAVPLYEGGTLQLTELRGQVVVLVLSTSDRPHWAEAQTHLEKVASSSEQVAVVLVANDRDAEALGMQWDPASPAFTRGWDPQGAVALRLGVAALPAAFVLAQDGRVVGSVVGTDPAALAKVDSWVADALR